MVAKIAAGLREFDGNLPRCSFPRSAGAMRVPHSPTTCPPLETADLHRTNAALWSVRDPSALEFEKLVPDEGLSPRQPHTRFLSTHPLLRAGCRPLRNQGG